MSGSPPESGPPPVSGATVADDPVDRAALASTLAGWPTPETWRCVIKRDGPTTVEIAEIDLSRGGDVAELHYPDGRYVTVSVRDELHRVEDPTA